MNKKIEKFASEPMSFYLHKKNDFFDRLKGKEKEMKFKEEKVLRMVIKNILTSEALDNDSCTPTSATPQACKDRMFFRLKQKASEKKLKL